MKKSLTRIVETISFPANNNDLSKEEILSAKINT